MGGASLMITITDRRLSREFAAWFQNRRFPLVLTAFGQGTATTEILDCLGLEATEKAVLLCAGPVTPGLVQQASRELWLDVPGRGILMTVPLSGAGGAAARDMVAGPEKGAEGGEEPMEEERTHELILVITNQGCTDQVMDAAREAGAAGGTSLHAKGTGTELMRKFLGVSIAAEKELVLILTKSEARNDIMKAVMAKAGMRTPAQSLVFSLPVSGIAGLREE